MNISVTGAYVYFHIPLFGGIPITQTTVSQLVVTVFLGTASVLLGRGLKTRPGRVQALTERGIALLQSMVVQTMGPHNLHWTPFIGTIFCSSLFGSYIGLTGFLRSSTADLSCPLVWALLVSVLIWYHQIRNRGFFGWLRGFAEPIALMTPMNLVSEIAQPISMAFRHFGNLAGGGVITSLIYTALGLASNALLELMAATRLSLSLILTALGLWSLLRLGRTGKRWLWVPGLGALVPGVFGLLDGLGVLRGFPFLSLGIPAVLSCYFDLFSGFVQAYVFTLLTMVYIAAALPEAPAKTGAADP